jgi:hypothetical protein
MAFDIILSFITPVGRMTGFLTAEPIQESLEEVTFARDKIQSSLAGLSYMSIFTRDADPIIGAEGTHYAMEISLPGEIIKNSVMVSQIVEVEVVA